MTHRGPFQPPSFCDSVKSDLQCDRPSYHLGRYTFQVSLNTSKGTGLRWFEMSLGLTKFTHG